MMAFRYYGEEKIKVQNAQLKQKNRPTPPSLSLSLLTHSSSTYIGSVYQTGLSIFNHFALLFSSFDFFAAGILAPSVFIIISFDTSGHRAIA